MAHTVNLLIHAGVFFNECIGARHIGFGLIIIIVRHEIFDGIIGKEAFKLRIELRGQCLIGRHDEGRSLRLLNDLGHSESFARPRHAEQDLIAVNRIYARDKLRNSFNLIAFGLKF